MRILAALALALGLLAGPGGAQAPAGPDSARYRDLGLMISSVRYGYGYGYGPTIVRDGGALHMIFCSYGRKGIWDYLRYAVSADGASWSAPVVVLEGTDEAGERATCDPSLVRFQAPGDAAPVWYLFYSGSALDVQTVNFVARAERIEGPYRKWTRRGTWEEKAPDPAVITLPHAPKPEKSPFYGAGQPSVVVRDGRLLAWYNDDTTCASPCPRIFMAATADPTAWPAAVPTNVVGTASADVKGDGTGFVMVAIEGAHGPASTLSRRRSTDGVRWSDPEIVCDVGCFPPFAHNVGIAGTPTGTLDRGPILAIYGAPKDRELACGICLGRWDLFGGTIAP